MGLCKPNETDWEMLFLAPKVNTHRETEKAGMPNSLPSWLFLGGMITLEEIITRTAVHDPSK